MYVLSIVLSFVVRRCAVVTGHPGHPSGYVSASESTYDTRHAFADSLHGQGQVRGYRDNTSRCGHELAGSRHFCNKLGQTGVTLESTTRLNYEAGPPIRNT